MIKLFSTALDGAPDPSVYNEAPNVYDLAVTPDQENSLIN